MLMKNGEGWQMLWYSISIGVPQRGLEGKTDLSRRKTTNPPIDRWGTLAC